VIRVVFILRSTIQPAYAVLIVVIITNQMIINILIRIMKIVVNVVETVVIVETVIAEIVEAVIAEAVIVVIVQLCKNTGTLKRIEQKCSASPKIEAKVLINKKRVNIFFLLIPQFKKRFQNKNCLKFKIEGPYHDLWPNHNISV
jgi:hypothetical protein